MKNRANPTWTHLETTKEEIIPLGGYNGYFVDRFNDIYSARRKSTPLAVWENKFPSGAIVERITIFDNDGKRRQLSRCKLIIDSIGKDEFERREKTRANRGDILAEESHKLEAWKKKQAEKDKWTMAEIHIDTPLHKLDPEFAEMVKLLRARRDEEQALGDLF